MDRKSIEDIYALSPLQQGMLFHTLRDPDSPAYFEQLQLEIAGPLDGDRFRSQWRRALARHGALRTSIHWEKLEKPYQIVHRTLDLPWEDLDWRDLESGERSERLARLLAQDKTQQIRLDRPPLMRFKLIRLEAERTLFLWTFHHVILDGWSLGIVLREVLDGYRCESEDMDASDSSKRYRDYILYLQRQDLGKSERHWRQRLAGFEAPTPLTEDRRASGAAITHEFKERRLELSEDLTSALDATARRSRLTLSTIAQGAWALLLSRRSGTEDIVWGAVVSGRPHDLEGAEHAVGMMINAQPARVRVSPDSAVAEWLAELQSDQAADREFQHTPLTDIRAWSAVASTERLFHSIVAVENYPLDDLLRQFAPGLRIAGAKIFEQSNYPLNLKVIPAKRLILDVLYDGDRFEDETAANILNQFRGILEQFVSNPMQRVREVSLLAPAERDLVTVQWNRTGRDYSKTCIHRIFEKHARASSDAPCLVAQDERLSYGEVNRRANRVARALLGMGVQRESPVGLCVGPTTDMVVGMLGILKAGAAFLPLDPEYPLERLAYMAADAGLRWALTDEASLSRLPNEVESKVLVRDLAASSAYGESEPGAEIGLENLAYIIYTSGSTGRPKGALLEHRGLANLVAAQIDMFGVRPESCVLQFSSLSFDASVFQIVMALAAGARLCIAPPAARYPGEALLDLLAGEKVSIVTIPPSVLAALPERELPDLRVITVAGEACPADLVKRWSAGSRFFNLYGPTETTIWATAAECRADGAAPPIGRPISNSQAYVLDPYLQPVPIGAPGELHVGGVGVGRGYLNRPELTAQKFVHDPFSPDPGARLYKTGDLVRWLRNGELEFLGRIDDQVKIRGFRIEPGEVQSSLSQVEGVAVCTVIVREDRPGDKQLVGYVTPRGGAELSESGLKGALREALPQFMVPDRIVLLPEMPLTPNGKIDRAALPPPGKIEAGRGTASPSNDLQRSIAAAWCKVLGLQQVGVDDNFFDLGGHSLLMVRLQSELKTALERPELTIVELFQFPTVRFLAQHLSGDEAPAPQPPASPPIGEPADGIAIIGMAGRFPDARNLDAFWQNLRNGVESIQFYGGDELLEAGVPRGALDDPRYVRAGVRLEGADEFDANFFGMNAREAETTDPQHRLFLECAHEALQSAGHETDGASSVGVFASSSLSDYLLSNLLPNEDLTRRVGVYQLYLGNDKDHLPTRVSYKLNLKGPSINVQTACSSSLVAVHLACRALRDGDCAMALAGGVSVAVAGKRGYFYQDQGIYARDGHCRPFDAEATGTYAGMGAGVVVLKPLTAALRDGDTVRAVIRGSAINNDAAAKAGYTAPSVQGQSDVIAAALDAAGVEASSVGYVEAHGTATALGDPIELKALTNAFRRRSTVPAGSCAIGALKSNIGHLDAAAGVAGLIKTVLQLEHKELVPTLHYRRPNPQITFEDSPFYVQAERVEWPRKGQIPRRAGVSSFGIGGTNAHAVLEEAPDAEPSGSRRPWQLLTFSAKTASALAASAQRLADYLRNAEAAPLADVAYTLQVGRRTHPCRSWIVAGDASDAARQLAAFAKNGAMAEPQAATGRPVAFLFPGQGSQYAGMGRGFYESERTYREASDLCFEILRKELGRDFREILFSSDAQAAETIKRTEFAQPALFVAEYALARLWMAWGVRPAAMLGHSIGEWVAAALAGVFSLEDALKLVVARGRLMQGMAPGAMMAVPLSADDVAARLVDGLGIAAINAPSHCVISGSRTAIEAMAEQLAADGIEGRRLVTSHAFHSASMDAAASELEKLVQMVERRAPAIPLISNLTGTWLSDEQARDAGYWARQLRREVRFADGVATLAENPDALLLEVGPGNTLASLTAMQLGKQRPVTVSMRGSNQKGDDRQILLSAAGRLWMAGGGVRWNGFYEGERRRRVSAPTYPYERERYFVAPVAQQSTLRRAQAPSASRPGPYCYLPSWRRGLLPTSSVAPADRRWLVVGNPHDLGLAIESALLAAGAEVALVEAAAVHEPERFFSALREDGRFPDSVIYLGRFGSRPLLSGLSERARFADEAFLELLRLTRGLAELARGSDVDLTVVTANLERVTGAENIVPENATLLGPCGAVSAEHPNVRCRVIDGEIPASGRQRDRLAGAIVAETCQADAVRRVAYRGRDRWTPALEPFETPRPATPQKKRLRERGVYLITGGLGGIGLELAQYLAESVRARLVLLSRSNLPEREEWQVLLESGDAKDPAAAKIRKIRSIEDAGGEVFAVRADVTRPADVERAVHLATERFGPIHGVIHAAGVEGRIAEHVNEAEALAVLAPKVMGALALEQALKDRELDFFALCSSLASIAPGAGVADYAAANAFLDAFAQSVCHETPNVLAINWGTWREVGMATRGSLTGSLAKWRQQALQGALTSQQGLELFDQALATDAIQITASGEDPAEVQAALPQLQKLERFTREGERRHARPPLSVAYEPPVTETQRKLCTLWEELLGVEPVGIHDEFFDLGGHSLLGTQLVAHILETFGVRVALRTLFELPTVAELASEIDEPRVDRLAESELLAAIEALSDEEAEAEVLRRGSLNP